MGQVRVIASPHDRARYEAKGAEVEFVLQWVPLMWVNAGEALEIVQYLPEEVFSDELLGRIVSLIANRASEGRDVTDEVTRRALLGEAKARGRVDEYLDLHSDWIVRHEGREASLSETRKYAREVLLYHRARVQADLIEGALTLTRDAIRLGEVERVRRISDDLMDRMARVHARDITQGTPRTHDEVMGAVEGRLQREEVQGFSWPWKKFNRSLGIIPVGKIVGVTGYPGSGKSMFASNFAVGMLTQDEPTIICPPEMGIQFLERMIALMARVPKRFAEEGDWREASDEAMERYRSTMRDMASLPWELIVQSNITPREFRTKLKILRRKFPGRRVLVIGDHMHRFDYGGDLEKGPAQATKDLRSFMEDDADGMSGLLIFQPRKPKDENSKYSPIRGEEIRGSGIFDELDVHLSCFQRIVKTTNLQKTPWGTDRAIYRNESDRMPERGTPGEPGTKADDEHFYVTYDKHRIRGQGTLETMVMHSDGPTGYIYEDDWNTNYPLYR